MHAQNVNSLICLYITPQPLATMSPKEDAPEEAKSIMFLRYAAHLYLVLKFASVFYTRK